MKFVLLLGLLCTYVAFSTAAKCKSNDDCKDKNYCCVIRGDPNRGTCMRKGRKGGRCSEPESALDYYGGRFLRYCPCSEGLECRPNNRVKSGESDKDIIRKHLRCQDLKTSKEDGSKEDKSKEDKSKDDGSKDDGNKDDGSKDDGSKDDGKKDDGSKDDGSQNDGSKDDGSKDNGSKNDGSKDNGSKNDGSKDDGSKDNGSKNDENGNDGDGNDNDGENDNGNDGSNVSTEVSKVREEIGALISKELRLKSSGQGIDEEDPLGGFDGSNDEVSDSSESTSTESNSNDDSLPDELIPV